MINIDKDENLLLPEIKPIFNDINNKNILNLKQNSVDKNTINNQNNTNNNPNNNIGIKMNMNMNINNFNINTNMNPHNQNMMQMPNLQYFQ